jgi:hypothetical protein
MEGVRINNKVSRGSKEADNGKKGEMIIKRIQQMARECNHGAL